MATKKTPKSTKTQKSAKSAQNGSPASTGKYPGLRDELPQKTPTQKRRAKAIYKLLEESYPDAKCALNHSTPHELLVATILSAQTTDVSVNKATPTLFKRFPTPADYAKATPEEIQPYVKTLGFFRNKAKSVHSAMTTVAEEHNGEVPNNMKDLLRLRGVARKTANVVLGNAFGLNEGVVVDTHVTRLAKRFGLSKETDPKKIEADLMALFPRESWTLLSHLLISHGRQVCKARSAICGDHPLCHKYCSNVHMLKKAAKAKSGRG